MVQTTEQKRPTRRTDISVAQFSIHDAVSGRANRGDLIRDGWNLGLLIGVRNGKPAIAWGLVNKTSDRFLSNCDRFDHGVPRKKLGGHQEPSRGNRY